MNINAIGAAFIWLFLCVSFKFNDNTSPDNDKTSPDKSMRLLDDVESFRRAMQDSMEAAGSEKIKKHQANRTILPMNSERNNTQHKQ